MAALLVGAVIDAKVTRVLEGALLLSYESMQGAVQLPEVAWVGASTKGFAVGELVRVRVIAVSGERFSASIRQLHPERNPWLEARTFAVGDHVECVARRVLEWGAWFTVGDELHGVWLFTESDVRPVEGQRVALTVSKIDDTREVLELRPRSA